MLGKGELIPPDVSAVDLQLSLVLPIYSSDPGVSLEIYLENLDTWSCLAHLSLSSKLHAVSHRVKNKGIPII